ncbi:MAG: cbb3-type cytochrome c oxidase subunit II [Armatimonadetes bacterium]|nr:cbb3-type cytochrome c oxidase subunit II [Armatimonadota bacterium]
MQMTERAFAIGSLLILLAAGVGVGFIPAWTTEQKPSDIARRRTPLEARGRQVYIQNGCTYCHTQYIRPQDWDHGAVRVAQQGDYVFDRPHLLGSERTGPDLSQEGGLRTDDWHRAHFMNPRFTRPASIMPQFRFLTDGEITALIAYVQSLGGKMADARVTRQKMWHKALAAAFARGTDANFAYLHSLVPEQWRTMPNPYPPTPEALARGRFIYEQSCIGCHGNFGDGNGPAARWLYPKPANFTALRRIGASGGLLYYQIMNGITGSSMPYFKTELESEKIWDVSNYIAVSFIGRSDGNTAPRGADAALEPVDPHAPPPPAPESVTAPPLTSPALQPEVNAARGGMPMPGGGRQGASSPTPAQTGPAQTLPSPRHAHPRPAPERRRP